VTASATGGLFRLDDIDLTIADPDADLRRRTVVDRRGDKVGEVDDLLVDDREHAVRFLRVKAGGFLAIGSSHYLVPVDAVVSVRDHRVHIDRRRAELSDVPTHDPDLAGLPRYYANVYAWWNATPYWAAGFRYPGDPGGRLR